MVRHLTWCLKRMFILSNHSSLHQRCMSIVKIENLAISSKIPIPEEVNIDHDRAKANREFLEDSKCKNSLATSTLSKILGIMNADAKKTVKRFPAIAYLSIKSIHKNYENLRKAGVCKSTIKDNTFLLADTTDNLKEKIMLIKMLNINPNDGVHLFHLSIPVLSSFISRSKIEATYLPNNNRIFYLAEKLNCDVGKICHMIRTNPHMLYVPVPKMLTITEFLLDSGVAPQYILADSHVYSYRFATIKKKIERARKLGVKPLKTWVVRCRPHIWEKITERSSNREITLKPDQTIEKYLAELFECDIKYVHHIMFKNPKFHTMNFDKLVKVATLIQREGYNFQNIEQSPRILHRSYETLKELFELRRQIGAEKLPLYRYLLSKEKFMECLKIIREEKKTL